METRLTFGERCRIEEMVRLNICNQAIARDIKRHPSTVTLEIERGGGHVNYTAKKGEKISKEWRKRLAENATAAKQQLKLDREKVSVIAKITPKDRIHQIAEYLRDVSNTLEKIIDDLK